MEIQYFGANCFRLNTKQATIVVDDNLEELKGKQQIRKDDIAIFTTIHDDTKIKPRLTIDYPGEFEASNVSFVGIATRGYMDEQGIQSSTTFKIVMEDIKILIVGHIHPDLTDEQLEQIGTVDIMIVPVGGNGYTLDGVDALRVIKKVEPKIIIPSHYLDNRVKLSYPVSQTNLDEAVNQLGMEVREKTEKLKIKNGDFPEISQLIVIEAS